jgi:hypothetical protein
MRHLQRGGNVPGSSARRDRGPAPRDRTRPGSGAESQHTNASCRCRIFASHRFECALRTSRTTRVRSHSQDPLMFAWLRTRASPHAHQCMRQDRGTAPQAPAANLHAGEAVVPACLKKAHLACCKACACCRAASEDEKNWASPEGRGRCPCAALVGGKGGAQRKVNALLTARFRTIRRIIVAPLPKSRERVPQRGLAA